MGRFGAIFIENFGTKIRVAQKEVGRQKDFDHFFLIFGQFLVTFSDASVSNSLMGGSFGKGSLQKSFSKFP